jgi:uncharacterized membrane protein YqjE
LATPSARKTLLDSGRQIRRDSSVSRVPAIRQPLEKGPSLKIIRRVFAVGYSGIIFLFICCALCLIVFAVLELWQGVNPGAALPLRARFSSILESIGFLTIAVVSLELGQTILEEEVLREVHVSSPTRVRRFLSRFMVVVIVALSIETLVAVFEFAHDDPSRLVQASSIGIAAALLLAAWGVFIRLNKSAEELEPEAMEKAKLEDHKVE